MEEGGKATLEVAKEEVTTPEGGTQASASMSQLLISPQSSKTLTPNVRGYVESTENSMEPYPWKAPRQLLEEIRAGARHWTER